MMPPNTISITLMQAHTSPTPLFPGFVFTISFALSPDLLSSEAEALSPPKIVSLAAVAVPLRWWEMKRDPR